MAELLINAKAHWKDSWDTIKVASLSQKELSKYNARTEIGDIIVVKPDNWRWGKEERLPNFIVVKLPKIDVKDVKIYEQSLLSGENLLKVRKYRVPQSWIMPYVLANQSIVLIDNIGVQNQFKNSIIVKTG